MTLRLANSNGRASLIRGERLLDVERRSDGRFGADPMALFGRWSELSEWAATLDPDDGDAPLEPDALGACVPRPQKVFGIGLNYRDHAAEAELPIPKQPLVFTKFPNCLVGPTADVVLTSNRVDWEVELVVVIGRGGTAIDEADALDAIAGYCVGQDISDRRMQFAGKPPQFSLGKSADTFGPIGPAVVSLAAFSDPHDLRLTCTVAGETMQDGRTRDMIFSVTELVAFLSRHCTLAPGDLIFTGTPAGVGSIRRRYLAPDEVIESAIEGIGRLRNRCVSA
jgi:2-keto-4-pentenoate hydratase/2-oxohepta-3-ene-1,7-dioic acid hydratase in catechol pathway